MQLGGPKAADATPSIDSFAGGYAIFLGQEKVAVVFTNDDQGVRVNGAVIRQAIPHDKWTIHFTRPLLKVDELKAVMAAIPSTAFPPGQEPEFQVTHT